MQVDITVQHYSLILQGLELAYWHKIDITTSYLYTSLLLHKHTYNFFFFFCISSIPLNVHFFVSFI